MLKVSLTKNSYDIYIKGCVRWITKYYILQHELTTAMQYQLVKVRKFYLNLSLLLLNTLVRLHADYRIKPHAPPFIQTPANLFKFYLCSFTPQARHFRVSLYTRNNFLTYDAHKFRVWTTRVSNPVWYPYFSGSMSEYKIINCRGLWESL